jgi:hypothetical protein
MEIKRKSSMHTMHTKWRKDLFGKIVPKPPYILMEKDLKSHHVLHNSISRITLFYLLSCVT